MKLPHYVERILFNSVSPTDRDGYREAWLERAAIAEYDGGLSRPEAEAVALADLRAAIERETDAK